GYGVEPDLAQAEQWYRKAAEQGVRRAKNALARLGGDTKAETVSEQETEDTKGYWVIAPYSYDDPEQWERVWTFNLANNFISIGWRGLGDISAMNAEALRAAIDTAYSEDSAGTKGAVFGMIWKFYHEIKPGDSVIARRGRKVIAGVGTVTRKAYHDKDKCLSVFGADEGYPNHIDVRWDESPRDKAFEEIVFGLQTVSQISPEKFRTL